jgi:hypothetical protein
MYYYVACSFATMYLCDFLKVGIASMNVGTGIGTQLRALLFVKYIFARCSKNLLYILVNTGPT